MKKISVSAPGKLLLMGDHAVVYGHPCIVTAISTRLAVTIEEMGSGGVQTDTPGVADTRFITSALETASKRWGKPLAHMRVVTRSEFTDTYGLGSSAAVTVATVFALQQFLGKPKTIKEIFDVSYEAVLAIQGVGSGFDVAAATFGGTVCYTSRKPIVRMNTEPIPLVVGYTGVKADTATIVKDVAGKRERDREKMDRIFSACAQLVGQAKIAMEESDWKRAGKLMDFNQEYLRDIGVSSEKLETLISAAKGAGAYGAKLSGAGGGDCMIALAPKEKRKAVEDAIILAGGQVIHILPNTVGARMEA